MGTVHVNSTPMISAGPNSLSVITRPKAHFDSDWKSDATCFAVSDRLGWNFEVRPDSSESRLQDLSNEYSRAPRNLLDQKLWSFEVGAVQQSESESNSRI